jgi:hypothetical protein
MARSRKAWFFVHRDHSGRVLREVELAGNPDRSPKADAQERSEWCKVRTAQGETWNIEERQV